MIGKSAVARAGHASRAAQGSKHRRRDWRSSPARKTVRGACPNAVEADVSHGNLRGETTQSIAF